MDVNTQPNVQSQQRPFDPSRVYRSYTRANWTQKEIWYIQTVQAIKIPPAPSTADIQMIAAEIDKVLTVARLDYAFISRMYDTYSMQLKVEEKKDFVELKQNMPQQFVGMKLTVDDMKGVVAVVIKSNDWQNTGHNLYELVEESSQRYIFLEGVIKTLQDKKDLLITHSGMMKIDYSITNFQGNVNHNTPSGGAPIGTDYKDSRE